MKVQKFRWSKVYESTEEELVGLLEAKNIAATRQEAEAFSERSEQTPVEGNTFWFAEGSCTLSVSGQRFSMQPGDALRVPAQTMYQVAAGLTGCAWYTT